MAVVVAPLSLLDKFKSHEVTEKAGVHAKAIFT